jgi:hypothetical protein
MAQSMHRLLYPAFAVSAVCLLVACDSSQDASSDDPNGVGNSGLKLSGIGDSIMQGYDASPCALPICFDQPQYSFAQGTEPSVHSLFTRFGSPRKEFVSVSGAQLIDGADSGVNQARMLCKQTPRPNRILVLLGTNDVCNSPSVDALPSEGQFGAALTETLATLTAADCALPEGSSVHVMSIPRVDRLRDNGLAKSDVKCESIWKTYDICRLVTNAPSLTTLLAVANAIDAYNRVIGTTVAAFDGTSGIAFSTDYVGATVNTSFGTYAFTSEDLSNVDCFHPSLRGQSRLACLAWETWQGDGNIADCFK